MMNRRQTIKLMGGGAVVAASAMGGFALTRTPDDALVPWQEAGKYEDIRLFALSYAILVPNPHNRQPWLAELMGQDELNIYRDLSKNLPATDPFERQLTIGMGGFLEAIDIAARHRGFKTEVTLFPSKTEDHIANIKLSPSNEIKPEADLLSAFHARRSCKEPFSEKPLSAAHAAALKTFGDMFVDAKNVEHLKQLSWNAFKVEYATHHTLKESVDLMRFGKKQINANPDGIDIGGPMMETLLLTGVLTPESMLDPNSSAYQQGLDMYDAMLNNTPAYILLKTPGNSREHQIEAGRNWLQLNLTTTRLGVSLQPVSQALQEYDEMKDLYQEIHQSFAAKGETIQMFGRLGYGPRVPQSPRWQVEKKLI
jgi:hypothetical protein